MKLLTYLNVKSDTDLITFCKNVYEKDLQRFNAILPSIEDHYSSDERISILDEDLDINLESKENNGYTVLSEKAIIKLVDHFKGFNINITDYFRKSNYVTIHSKETGNTRRITIRNTKDVIKYYHGQRVHGSTGFGNEGHAETLSVGRTETIAKKKYRRPKNVKSCFTFNDLDSYFNKYCPGDLPTIERFPSSNTISESDRKSFKEYTKPCRPIQSNLQSFICGSMLHAFDILGIPRCNQMEDFSISSRRIKPLSPRTAVDLLSKNTNSGWDLFGRKNDPEVQKSTIFWLNQYLRKPSFYRMKNKILREINTSLNSIFSDLFSRPTYIMHRFQISPIQDLAKHFEIKIRTVWCIPYAIVALEAMFFEPMLRRVKLNALESSEPKFPIGLNNKQLSEKVALPLNRRAKRSLTKTLRTSDFSKYDQTIEPIFTSFFYSIWGSNIDFTRRKAEAYEVLRLYSMFTPFIDNGRVYMTRKGLCSGSYTTNIRGSIINLTLIICALRIKYQCEDLKDKILSFNIDTLEHTNHDFMYDVVKGLHRVNINGFVVYGDDGIGLEDDDFFLIHKFICDEFGLNITYKNNIANSFYFLGRFWDNNGLPWQSVSYKIAHIKFRTKWYDKDELDFSISKYLDLYRVLSICLPLRDGKDFLYSVLYDWKPFRDFIESNNNGYYLLKEFPHDEYKYIDRDEAFKLSSY